MSAYSLLLCMVIYFVIEFNSEAIASCGASNRFTPDYFIRITSLPPNSGSPPETKNWVEEGAVTDVKMESTCECSWAFTAAGAIEAQVFIYKKKLQSLSAQNLLDCVGKRNGINNTCSSSSLLNAMEYVVENNGIDTDEGYPYVEKQGECRYDPCKKGATIKDFKRLEEGNENLLKDVVGLIGPVACGFSASYNFAQYYKAGIYCGGDCGNAISDLNYAMLVVGYGTEQGKDYWLCKNNWGSEWGDKGYFKVARNLNNTCGIASDCYYPVY